MNGDVYITRPSADVLRIAADMVREACTLDALAEEQRFAGRHVAHEHADRMRRHADELRVLCGRIAAGEQKERGRDA